MKFAGEGENRDELTLVKSIGIPFLNLKYIHIYIYFPFISDW